jgi:exonuclease VII large subunit
MKTRTQLQVINLQEDNPKPLDFNDTSQLQQFINVDFEQISKERDRHLHQAFSSTLKQR